MLNNNWKIQPSDVFACNPIIPVIVIDELKQALPLAEKLIAKGINILEVTLRTPCALQAITQINKQFPEALVGAGTILNKTQLCKAQDAGAQFAISPGITPELLQAGRQTGIPLIPGIATISEIMTAMDLGYNHFKFFPAEASGGIAALKAFSGPLSDIRFCPTGGITEKNYKDYLALNNVDCVGGSWVVPDDFNL